MITILRRAAFILVTILMASSAASAQATLYDNFETSKIDPSKWIPTGPDLTLLAPTKAPNFWLDTTRQITNAGAHTKVLELSGTGYAPTTDNSNVMGTFWGVGISSPSAVTAISYKFVVKKAEVGACKSSSQVGQVSPSFQGSFFNVNPSPIDQTGDVFAGIFPLRYATDNQSGPLSVYAALLICTNSTCTANTIFWAQMIGSVSLSSQNTASVAWQQPQHQFTFNLNGTQLVAPYVYPDTSPPAVPYRILFLNSSVPDCTAAKRPSNTIDATFDDVYVNP